MVEKKTKNLSIKPKNVAYNFSENFATNFDVDGSVTTDIISKKSHKDQRNDFIAIGKKQFGQ